MATLYASKDHLNGDILNEWLKKLGSSWLWISKKATPDKPKTVIRDGKIVDLSSNKTK